MSRTDRMVEMSAEKARELAIEHFAKGFNCAEAVLLGMTQAFGLEASCVPRIATAFGAGIARRGEACGALAGAAMALGLRFGREDPADRLTKDALYAKMDSVMRAFEKEFGSVRCIDLTGVDMSTPEGWQKAIDMELHIDFCPKFVAFAAEQAARLITDD